MRAPESWLQSSIITLCVLLLFVNKPVRCEDPGAIVNALSGHTTECGIHDWQVTASSNNCGTAPCNYKQSWCASEDFTQTCIPLSPACQAFLPDETAGPIGGGGVGVTGVGVTAFSTLFPNTAPITAAPASPATPPVDQPRGPLPGQPAQPITAAPIPVTPAPPAPGSGLITLMCGCQCPCQCPINSCSGGAVQPQPQSQFVGMDKKPNQPLSGTGFARDGPISGSSSGCSDFHPTCQTLASTGDCLNNPRYMLSMCKASCHQCGI